MKRLEAAVRWAEENEQSSIQKLADLVRQPSISSTGEGVEACSRLLCGYLGDAGLEACVLPTPGLPAVYAERLEPGKPVILFYGHYDVQPPGPLDQWKTPPFEPAISGGRIYGRGTADNKGQLLTHIVAAQAFMDTDGSLPCGVKILLDGEEESGSPNLPGLVRDRKDLLKCDLVYASDGPIHQSGRPQAIFGCRGILDFEIEIRDNIRDCHSGHFGGVISNPAWRMAHLLESMCGPDGEVLVDGFYDNVRPVTPGEERLLSQIPFDEKSFLKGIGVPDQEGRGPVESLKRIMFRPTLNINGLGSGHMGEGMRSIVPYRAVCRIDVRLAADQEGDDVFDKIVRHVKERVPEASVSRVGLMEPSRTSVDLPESRAIVAAVRRSWGVEPVVMPSSGGSLPDYVFTRILGVPSATVPYANTDESNHAPNENLNLELFTQGVKTSMHVMDIVGSLNT